MKTVFIATSNKGKQNEIGKYAKQYGNDIVVRFPDETNELKVDESGSTFEENALLKAKAYHELLNDDSIIYVGDDSGLKIHALNDEPGVYTRRWAGYEMSDAEIPVYCLEKMRGLSGDERKATFETVLAVVVPNEELIYYRGKMPGRILDAPIETAPAEGFPFRAIFWADEINLPMYEINRLPANERGGFLTHREKAFKQLFESLTA